MSGALCEAPGSSHADGRTRPGQGVPPPVNCRSFDSDDLPERDRIPIWREMFSRTVAKADWNPIEGEPFRSHGKLCGLPGLGVRSMTISRGAFSRSRAQAADGSDDFLLSIPITGRRHVSHLGRELLVESGSAILLTGAEPASSTSPSTARGMSILIPSRALTPLLSDRDAATARPIPRDTAALQLLIGYAELLLQGHTLSSPELQSRAVSHVYDLVALALGATRDATHVASGRGVRAARLEAVRADILANLSQVRLSPQMIARRHGVTERYVHLLFEQTGETFGEFVTKARLDRAIQFLRDPACVAKIGDIALKVGYGEVSTFNRAFRRHFGRTPSDARQRQ